MRNTEPALHEAAHAVVSWRFGYSVSVLTLLDEGGYCGHELGTDPLPQAIIAMAGHAADMKWRGHERDMVPFEDHCSVLSYGFAGRSIPTILNLARGAVEEYAGDIERVASDLEERDLCYHDMERLLGELEPAEDCPSGIRSWLLWHRVVISQWLTARRIDRQLRRENGGE